jgi:hypothetical protein
VTREPVESSVIRSVGHDPDTQELHVEFVNGRVYRYREVTPEQYRALVEAPSKGAHIRTLGAGTLIPPDEGA